jgi:hypothetical protein
MLVEAGHMAVGSSRLGNPVGQEIQVLGRIDNTWREVGPAQALALGPAGLVVEKGVYRSVAPRDDGLIYRSSKDESDGSLRGSQFNGRDFMSPYRDSSPAIEAQRFGLTKWLGASVRLL